MRFNRKKEAVQILMQSPIYFKVTVEQRLENVHELMATSAKVELAIREGHSIQNIMDRIMEGR